MGSTNDSPGRILLVGADPAAAHELLSAIRQQPAPQQPPVSYPWRLDTNYYTADVHFDVRHLDQCGEVQLGDGAYEAVLLVFDAAGRAGFDSLQAWWDAAGGGDADLGVRLAVATRLPPGARPDWLTAAEEWCTEQLVEYVETDQAYLPAAPAAAGEQQQAAAGTVGADMGAGAAAAAAGLSGRAEETAGVHRICEALQAHMWPGMQLKPSPRHGAAAPSAAAAAAAQGTEDEREEPAEDAVPPAAAAPNGLPPAAAAGAGAAVNDTTTAAAVDSASAATAGAAIAAGGAAAGQEFGFADYVQSPPGAAAVAAAGMQLGAGGTGGATAGAAGVGEEEGEAEQMERLFAQVSSHREQVAQMPDAQRRDAAAAMVSQLMAAMGLDEEEEEEEEEGEDQR